MTRRVVDATMFTYERAAMRVRLAELAEVVDRVHVVSGNRTYQGDPQTVPLLDGVEHRIVDLTGFGDARWLKGRGVLTDIEQYQRNSALTMAAEGEPEDTLYVFSDGDEIPHPAAVARAAAEYDTHGPRVLPVSNRYWFANWASDPKGTPAVGHHLNQPIIATLADMLALGGAQKAREGRGYRPRTGPKWATCGPSGWHLGGLDGPAMIAEKFGKFAHREDNNPRDRDLDRLADAMRRRVVPKHEWPLHETDDLPTTIDRFPELVA